MERYIEGYTYVEKLKKNQCRSKRIEQYSQETRVQVEIREIMNYIVTRNGLKPITPRGGVMPETPAVETPPPQGGEGVILCFYY